MQDFFSFKASVKGFLCVFCRIMVHSLSASRNLETYIDFLHIDLFLRTVLSLYFSVFSVLCVSVLYQFPEIVDTWNILNHVDYFPSIQNVFKDYFTCCILLCSMQNRFSIKLLHISFVTNSLLVHLNCHKLKFL